MKTAHAINDDVVLPTPELTGHARELLPILNTPEARIVLRNETTSELLQLDHHLFMLIKQIIEDLAQNKAVTVCHEDLEMTTIQASDFLNVSRPYLIKILESGEIPFRKVGSHRRIRLEDLVEYKKSCQINDKSVRESLTKEAEKLGLGY